MMVADMGNQMENQVWACERWWVWLWTRWYDDLESYLFGDLQQAVVYVILKLRGKMGPASHQCSRSGLKYSRRAGRLEKHGSKWNHQEICFWVTSRAGVTYTRDQEGTVESQEGGSFSINNLRKMDKYALYNSEIRQIETMSQCTDSCPMSA